MKKVYNRIPQPAKTEPNKFIKKVKNIKSFCLSFFYLAASKIKGTPGISFHLYLMNLGIKLLLKGNFQRDLIFFPMDSIRYFEFDFMWEVLKHKKNVNNYLDISSPRNFLFYLLSKENKLQMTIVNPDNNDLSITKELIKSCALEDKCTFLNDLVEKIKIEKESFDIVSSISVLEHMPDNSDYEAVKKMWQGVKKGGSLLISVSCASRAFEEYLDYNEYKLLPEDENGFVFGSKFYDMDLLHKKIFSITGEPSQFKIYGEVVKNSFNKNRSQKFIGNYPFWKEPYFLAKNFKYYNSLDRLPGVGVIAMEFIKK